MSIESVMLSRHLILCRPLLLLPSSFPSIRVFSNESILCIRWPKYWNFIFSINPSNEHSGLISFTIDWLDLLAVQGTLRSLLQTSPQCKSITSLVLSFLYSSTFTPIHDYWKIHSFEYMDLVDKVCLCLLIRCLGLSCSLFSKEHASSNFMAAVTICSYFGAPQNKVSQNFHCFPNYLP